MFLAEIGVRLHVRISAGIGGDAAFRRPDPIYHHGLVPNTRGRQRTAEWDVEYRINNLGLRDRDTSRAKPRGTYRILWVGDSTIEGAGLELEETVPKRLEHMLNSGLCSSHFEVLNGGIASFSPLLEYLFVRTVGLQLDPDMILQHFDMSDVQDDYFYSRLARFDDQNVPKEVPGRPGHENLAGVALSDPAPQAGLVRRILRSSALYRLVGNDPLIGKVFGVSPTGSDSSAYLEAHGLIGDIRMDRYAITRDNASEELLNHGRGSLRYLNLMGELLRARGVRWVLTVSPYGHQVSAEESEPGRRFFGLGPGLYRSDRPFRILEDFGARNHVAVINTLSAFRQAEAHDRPLFYRYDVHFNARGARVYAAAVRDALVRSGSPFLARCSSIETGSLVRAS